MRYFTFKPSVKPVLQSEIADCGLACIAMILGSFGYLVDLSSLKDRYGSSIRGTTLWDIVQIAEEAGVSAAAFKVDTNALNELTCPALLHWDMSHFVVLLGCSRLGIVIIDPTQGRRKISWSEVQSHFTGIAATFQKMPTFKPADRRLGLTMRQMVPSVSYILRALAPVLCLSLVFEILGILVPLSTKVAVDEAVPNADTQLLKLIAVLTITMLLGQASIALARGRLLISFGARLSLLWEKTLFARLNRLKIGFFEATTIGDVVTQFGALETIQNTISSDLSRGIVDGLFGVLLVTALFVLSPLLAGISLIATGLDVIARVLSYLEYGEATNEALTTISKQQSHLVETVRGAATIRLLSIQKHRNNVWGNRCVDRVSAVTRLQSLDLKFGAATDFLFGIDRVLILVVGAQLVIDNSLTLGSLTAFILYREQLAGRTRTLVASLLRFSLLNVQTERLSSITLSQVESQGEETNMFSPAWAQARQTTVNRAEVGLNILQVKNVSFAYDRKAEPVFENLSFDVLGRGTTAIVGRSGSGKTTLLKCLVGLLEPDTGDISYLGRNVYRDCLSDYRQNISGVLQDDYLFSGSLLQNLSSFDEDPDIAAVEHACYCANILDEVSQLPMGLDTLVGDMGSAFSGGQNQRLFLARALYRKPRLLFLDEATSHLDQATETLVVERLDDLEMARVVIAHRLTTIEKAQKVVSLDEHARERPAVIGRRME